MSGTPTMKAYIKQEMRFVPGVKVRQTFRVQGRGFDISRSPHLTPIVINNYNRIEYLQQLLDALRSRGYENIYIIDNASTYEPLLEFYERERLRVFYLSENVGYLAMWKTEVHRNFVQNYYVYTDPDVIPVDECPADFISYFRNLLQTAPELDKAGFGLKIDDLPPHNPHRDSIIEHESQFWTRPVSNGLYMAPIDTTFALYRPQKKGGWWLPAVRTADAYLARHLPWYENPADLSEELVFYRDLSRSRTHWTDLAARTVDTWPPNGLLLPWAPECPLFAEENQGGPRP